MSSTPENRSVRLWYALDVESEAAAREAVEYALMEAGALGTETDDADVRQTSGYRDEEMAAVDKLKFVEQPLLRVTAYFDQLPNRERVRAELAEAFRIYELPSSSVRRWRFAK